VLGTLSLSVPLPASAAITGCAGGNTGIALASDILTPGFTCTIDDKIYSNFTYSAVKRNLSSGVFSGISSGDQFSFGTIGAGGLTHNLNVQFAGALQNAIASLGYTVTRASGTNVFRRFSGNLSGDTDTNWALSIAASNAGTSSTAGYPALGQAAVTPQVNFVANTISSAFFNTLDVNENGSGMTQFANRLDQQIVNVPGPLPVIGAGAAFGFSRKLRRRSKPAL